MSWAAQRLRAEAAQFEHLADDLTAVYQPVTGDPVTLPVIIRTDWQYDDDGLPKAEREVMIDFRKADWSATPKPGDTITSASTTYTVVGPGVADQEFDATLWRVRCRGG
ncbi:MAG: hypothetical protein KDK05_12010 [Candidatus Competibacteraceae bacterium]|nr:hypothetical protein [Candidatus Competibacteraceae bacterium]